MLKQSVRLVSLFWIFALNFSPQLALASEPAVTTSTSSTSVTSPTNSTDYLINLLTQRRPRLEISIGNRQVTLYRGTNPIKSYPIAVGRKGWETPTGSFKVLQMLQNPTWIHPFTGESIKGGDPENPLGHHWIGFWTNGTNWIGFHGTPNPESVGKPASHGCIRMYAKDVEELFKQVSVGTPVSVVP